MWRNSARFSSKLRTCIRVPLLHHGLLSRSTSTAARSGPESTEPAGWVRTGSSAVDLSSFAAASSVLKARDVFDFAKHYARCYSELSKARLRSVQANMLAAGLGASNLVLYAFVYTPLKQIHPINTWVGAIVGAIPPLLGWAAASGQVSLNGMLLPAALYFWQLPHFMALAYLCRKDYADGGFRMFSLADASGQRTAAVALRNCLYLLPLGYLAYDWGLTSGWFCLESTLLAVAISGTAMSFYLNRTTKGARRMFHASLLYLPVFMSGLLVHRVTESEQQMTIENSSKIVEMSSSLETTEEAPEGKRTKRPGGNGNRRPPVAYASVAPFPFLPAPSYATP